MAAVSAATGSGGSGLYEEMARRARLASVQMSTATSEAKNQALAKVIDALGKQKDAILKGNDEDCTKAKEADLPFALQKRLSLRGGKFEGVLEGLGDLQKLEDPAGKVTLARRLAADGPVLLRVTAPIGVILVVFESRPDAAVQIASLCIKSGNAVILKGGKEATKSNAALVKAIRSGLEEAGLPADAVQFVDSREAVSALLQLDEHIDLVIPRGSNALVKAVQSQTRIPVLGHADGICSMYLHEDAVPDKAARLVVDSKTQYVAACNACETLLVNRKVAGTLLLTVGEALLKAGVRLHACPESLGPLRAAREKVVSEAGGEGEGKGKGEGEGGSGEVPSVEPAGESDFDTEWLSMCLSVKVVEGTDEAVAHINEHGSGHTDCIVCEDKATASYFLARVLSAACFHNASTRFCDGFRFGFGAESGISTSKVHARGPVGLEGLCLYKYKLLGDGMDPGSVTGAVAKEVAAAGSGKAGASGAGGSTGGVHAVADFGTTREFNHKDLDGVAHGASEADVLHRLGYC